MSQLIIQKEQEEQQEAEDCPICLQVLAHEAEELPCHHKFCSNCLKGWRSQYNLVHLFRRTCPKCRQAIPPSKEMVDQMKFVQHVVERLRVTLASPAHFALKPESEPDIFSFLHTKESRELLAEYPQNEHDFLLRTFYQHRLEHEIEPFLRKVQDLYGDSEDVIDQDSSQNALYFYPEGVLPKLPEHRNMIIQWLGSPPVSKDMLNAKVTKHDLTGLSLLHLAAKFGDVILLNFLLENGAEIDIKDVFGGTPFFGACCSRHGHKCARILLQWGASKETNNGTNVGDILEGNGHKKLATVIRTELGGRRCEILGLAKRCELNGKTAIVRNYLEEQKQHIVCVEETREKLRVPAANLKRQDRTLVEH